MELTIKWQVMKCPKCPYYEQKTSYGIELVKCNNKDCQYYEVMPQAESEDKK